MNKSSCPVVWYIDRKGHDMAKLCEMVAQDEMTACQFHNSYFLSYSCLFRIFLSKGNFLKLRVYELRSALPTFGPSKESNNKNGEYKSHHAIMTLIRSSLER